jgi:hypothetical protein
MGGTTGDGDGLFRQPPDVHMSDDHPAVLDDSEEARFPLEADPADVLEQQQSVRVDEDGFDADPADLLEQQHGARADDIEFEADPADVLEQRLSVPVEDDYRG